MNITTERLIEIENERAQTASDPAFQQWAKDIGASIVYRDQEPRLRAKDLNSKYDFSKMFLRRSKLMSYFQ